MADQMKEEKAISWWRKTLTAGTKVSLPVSCIYTTGWSKKKTLHCRW